MPGQNHPRADLDLAVVWSRVVDEQEQRRASLTATVAIDARFLQVLRTHFGRRCELISTSADGRARVQVAAASPVSLAEKLAGWGDAIEVVEPTSVRAELARIGAELTARYGADAVTGQPIKTRPSR